MKTIRFWTSHGCKDPRQWSKWLELDADQFHLVYNPETPDWLFGDEHLYLSTRLMKEFLSLLVPVRPSLYFAREAVEPDLNLFDYAVAHDRGAANLDRLGRCPVFTFHNNYGACAYSDLSKGSENPVLELQGKTGFCSFLYSNPNSHPRRDQLFHILSRYKRVDSLGPHLHNTASSTSRFDRNWKSLAIRIKSAYKFDIAAENARYAGYTTEKIMSAFMARTIPVYWGNPLIAKEFNPAAFVNANDMTDDELLDAVKRIDEDDSIYCRMLAAPPMTAEQVFASSRELEQYRAWTNRVFDQSFADAIRRPIGTWASIYRNSFRSVGVRFFKNHNWTALPSKIRARLAEKCFGRRAW